MKNNHQQRNEHLMSLAMIDHFYAVISTTFHKKYPEVLLIDIVRKCPNLSLLLLFECGV